MCSYVPLFLAFARRNGYSCEISEPQLVCGSATPPPNRRYPGLVCYMVTVTVNGVEYHGYGPGAKTALRFAAFEAYKALNPRLKKLDAPATSLQDDGLITDSEMNDDVAMGSTTAEESEGESCLEEGYRYEHQMREDRVEGRHDTTRGSGKNVVSTGINHLSIPQDKSSRITDNPVGQLQEVFMKEFQTLPTFAESVQVNGRSTQFVCFIKMGDLSARGQ